jgi:hypothetical protein
LTQVAASLAECLEALGDGRRSLLAHCTVFGCARELGDWETERMALQHVRLGARRELPELALEGLDDESAVTTVQKELIAAECRIDAPPLWPNRGAAVNKH